MVFVAEMFISFIDSEKNYSTFKASLQVGFTRCALVCITEQSGSSQTGILDKTMLEGTSVAPLWVPAANARSGHRIRSGGSPE